MRLAEVGRKLEFGDLLLPLYFLVFLRQYLWSVDHEFTAWALAAAVTLIVWLLHMYTKPAVGERTPRLFWAVVGLPLLFIYFTRAAIPDFSFDVVNHHLIQGERALRGPQFLPGDFFPTIFPFNPSSDMITGIFRFALGYRLGTIVNLLVLLWAGTIVEKLLRPIIESVWQRCLGVLLVLFTEYALFEINNYMVDLLALPLLLEAMRLALRYPESESKRRDLLWSALLLGTATGLKLTSAAVVLPILAVFAVRLFAMRFDASLAGTILLAGILFLLPVLPHAVYIWHRTGSPVFPLYNNIIGSPFWPDIKFHDGRWGPHNWRETVGWPLLSTWVPKRLSELGVYAGRLTIAFVAAALCLLLPRVALYARLLALATVLGSLMWSVTSGYVRYALFVEILGGVLVLYLSRYIMQLGNALPRPVKLSAAALPLCLLILQCAASAHYVGQTEWSRRPTMFDDPIGFRRELRWVWRDRDLMKFQSAENRQLFEQVDAWVVSSVKSNGVEVLLRPDVPMLAVNNLVYFDRPEPRQEFARALENLRGKRVYSLSLTDEFDSSVDFLKRRELAVGQLRNMVIPFFSTRTQLAMTLIEVVLPEKHPLERRQPGQPEVTEATAPLSDNAFLARLSGSGISATMQPGQTSTVRVVVNNLSNVVWPSRGRQDSTYLVNVADIWFEGDGQTLVSNTDGRISLPHDLWPGETAEVQLRITAPRKRGDYVLEIDLVQEGVAFFKDKGSQTWHTRVRVE